MNQMELSQQNKVKDPVRTSPLVRDAHGGAGGGVTKPRGKEAT